MDVRTILEQLYPQVDRRIIRATAMEHKNDLEAGVAFIEGEVLGDERRSMEATQILERKDKESYDFVEFPGGGGGGGSELSVAEESSSGGGEAVVSEEPEMWKSFSSSTHAVDCESIEQLIEQTKDDKQKLIASIREMKELRRVAEQAEAAASFAREQVLDGAQALEAKAAEIRKKIADSREQNAVHFGEVYGEKAVLGTEAKELFSRVQQVRTQWIKASDILEEMKSTLQSRIDAAKEDERAADEERLQKESAAREAIRIEEETLAQFLRESIELDAEAESCTKLREFLMRQGTVVDSLQGEISILHEDVELLKKKVDGLVVDSFHSASQAGSVFAWEPEPVTDLATTQPSNGGGGDDDEGRSAAAMSTSSLSQGKLSSSSSGSWQFLETEQ